MVNTQHYLPVQDIKDGLLFLKDGSVSLIIETSAVNFALLFETEQMGIISSFAGFLNSLSFPIQIINLSRRLDVSSYLKTLDKALAAQANPLTAKMTIHYRRFVESLIKENDVLDKKFFICINVTSAEISVLPQKFQEKSKKALIVLTPRKDHIVRQLAKIGLKARQLSAVEIIKLLYEIYNPPQNGEKLTESPQDTTVNLPAIPAPAVQGTQSPPRPPLTRITPIAPISIPIPPSPQLSQPKLPNPSNFSPATPYSPIIPSNPRHPFVVEELHDDLGS